MGRKSEERLAFESFLVFLLGATAGFCISLPMFCILWQRSSSDAVFDQSLGPLIVPFLMLAFGCMLSLRYMWGYGEGLPPNLPWIVGGFGGLFACAPLLIRHFYPGFMPEIRWGTPVFILLWCMTWPWIVLRKAS